MKVKLRDIIEAMEMANESARSFLDIQTGAIETLFDDLADDEEQEEISERLDEHGFVRLPKQYDIHEYHIMEEFIEQLQSPMIQECLSDAINGRGAFQRFKRGIRQYGVEQDWYDFREAAFLKIAREWCEENDLEYEK